LYAIQLAKLSGLNVITSCSPRNFDLVKSLGATDAYDYSDASNPAKIKAKYPTLALGFDCIAEKGSTAFLAQSLGSNGGKIVTLLPVQPENQGGVANVVVESTLVYTVLGKDFDFPGWKSFPADPQDKADMEKWYVLHL
jgi:NADPH:quinone reductase-like Zn-dependent oxidoreductase